MNFKSLIGKAMRLITNPETAIEGIQRFHESLEKNPNHPIVEKLPRFRAWYKAEDANGRPIFGPSKFIGYAGMTIDEYAALKGHGLDGRQTENALRHWFDEPAESPKKDELEDALHDFLDQFGKRPSIGHRISILKKGINVGDIEAAQALFTLFKTLPESAQAHFSRLYRP